MPPLPTIADVYQVSTLGTFNGLPCDHVINWHVGVGTSDPATVAQTFANADRDGMNNHMLARLPAIYTLVKSRCVYLGNTAVLPQEAVSGTAGLNAGVIGSHATCATIRHPAGVRGRGKDGRTNFPGPVVGDITPTTGELTAAAITAWGTAFGLYTAEIQAAVNAVNGQTPVLVILNKGHTAYQFPGLPQVDVLPNTHRRWQKRLGFR